EALSNAVDADHRFRIAFSLFVLGILAITDGAAAQGTRVLGASDAFLHTMAGVYDPDERADRERCLAVARETLGDTAFDEAWAEGQAMTLEQGIADALEVNGT